MIYPEFLKKGDTIAVTAPSDGNSKPFDFARVDLAKEHLGKRGYEVVETPNVRTSIGAKSSDAKTRQEQFLSVLQNDDVKAVISAKGGDFLMEILKGFPFDYIQKNPKWIQGYSDNTGIVFPLTVLYDVASIYGNNFNDFAMEPWHLAVERNLSILEGKLLKQESFDTFEDGFFDKEQPSDGYYAKEPVCWKNLYGEEEVHMEGRLIGGCLDVLLNLVGTPYADMTNFLAKYAKEGILWYLESFSLDTESVARGLWQLKEAGWFQGAKGFIFGRPAFCNSFTGMSYAKAVTSILEPMGVPVILDADIGHKGPQFTIINGAYGIVESKDGKGSLQMVKR